MCLGRSPQVATFLANKTCKDCVAFYYDTKKITNYKVLLREQTTALRRRMARTSWPLTLRAARELGVKRLPVASTAKMQRATAIRMPDYTFSALPTAHARARARARPGGRHRAHERRRAQETMLAAPVVGRGMVSGRRSPAGTGSSPRPAVDRGVVDAVGGRESRRRRPVKRRSASPSPQGDAAVATEGTLQPVAKRLRAKSPTEIDHGTLALQPGSRSRHPVEFKAHSGPLTHSISIAASSLGRGPGSSGGGDHNQLKQILASLQSKPADCKVARGPASTDQGGMAEAPVADAVASSINPACGDTHISSVSGVHTPRDGDVHTPSVIG